MPTVTSPFSLLIGWLQKGASGGKVWPEGAWSDHHGHLTQGVIVRVLPGEPDDAVGSQRILPFRRVASTLKHHRNIRDRAGKTGLCSQLILSVPISYSDTSQTWTFVSSCIQKGALRRPLGLHAPQLEKMRSAGGTRDDFCPPWLCDRGKLSYA